MKKRLSWLGKNFAQVISGTGFTLMLVAVTINVFSRYILKSSFSATEELAYMGFNYCVFFGICILYKKHAMVAIDIVVDRLPKGAQRVINVLIYLLLTVGNFVMVYYSAKLAVGAWIRPTAALRIPYTFVDLAAVLAFFVLGIYSIGFFIDALRGKELTSASLEERA